ncbi:MAG: S26 family signal peptidase [Acidimicrobiales bacterium]
MLVGVAAVGGAIATARRLVLRVEGDSMQPALEAGDFVVVAPRWLRTRPISVGRVVVVADPSGRNVIKRVRAIAGGWAELAGEPAIVDKGHVAIEGDNRASSTDSRTYGSIPLDQISAVVVAAVRRRGSAGRSFAFRLQVWP